MTSSSSVRRIVPVVLGAAMLVLIVAAGLSPNTGALPAQTNCTYSQCVASSTPFPWWIVAVVVALVVAALLALLFVMRRRRRPPAAATPLSAWSGSGAQPPAGVSPPAGPSAAPSYLETAEDVGHLPPPVAVAGPAVVAGAAGAAATEPEPDIDSLMAELDKISGEILKRAPKKGSGGGSSEPPEQD